MKTTSFLTLNNYGCCPNRYTYNYFTTTSFFLENIVHIMLFPFVNNNDALLEWERCHPIIPDIISKNWQEQGNFFSSLLFCTLVINVYYPELAFPSIACNLSIFGENSFLTSHSAYLRLWKALSKLMKDQTNIVSLNFVNGCCLTFSKVLRNTPLIS